MVDDVIFDENWNLIEPGTQSVWDEIETLKVVDSNGTELLDGDSIIAIKWLAVKWWVDIKKWEKFTNIKLIDDETHISVNTNKNWKMFLKVAYFKKW